MGVKDHPFFNMYRMQFKYSEKKWVVWVIILLFILANAIGVLEPYLIGKLFEQIQFHSESENFLGNVIFYLFLVFLSYIGFWVFHGPARVIERQNAYAIHKKFRLNLLNKVMHLPASWHRDNHSGDTIDKINRAGHAIGGFSESNFRVISMFTRIAGSLIALILIDWKAAIFATIISVCSLFMAAGFDKKLEKQYKKLYKGYNKIASAIHDYVSNIVTVITLRLKSTVLSEVGKRIDYPYKLFQKNIRLNEVKWFLMSMMVIFMQFAVLSWTSFESYLASGTIAIGMLYMLYGYLDKIGDSFYAFGILYGEVVEKNAQVVAANPLFEAYDLAPKHKEYSIAKNWKHISIQNLNFRYDAKGKKHTINDVNLELHKGKNIALIGKSGAGKSTVMSLLRGLYRTEYVQVLCDNKVLKHKLHHIWGSTTLIPQDPEIFNATVKDNITMGIHFTKKEVQAAVNMSRFAPVIKKLPKGLQTSVVEKGVSLSGGEKQRLALARGLLAGIHSDIILMDEPTSSVDSPNEIAIYKKILKKYKQKTIISSIHRLNLLHMFDYIYLFKDGKVIAEGTFRQMLKSKHFKPMWDKFHSKQ